MKAILLLEDGTIFEGFSFGGKETTFGEIVFNTGMTGYQEILTDPSYAGQIVVMTYPLIGNYGVNKSDMESRQIQVQGFVVKEYAEHESHWQSNDNISKYLDQHNIPGIYGIDTRMLTKKIRNQGAMRACITTEKLTNDLIKKLNCFVFPKDIVAQVSTKEYKVITGNNKKIGLIDLGTKQGIIHQLQSLGYEVHLFPWNTSAKEILDNNLDAVLLSNGPGDPKDVTNTIETTKNLIGKLPLYGICLGHQVLALALGADTYKLKFGHRGSNHPVQDIRNNKVFMSSQNHGYAVSQDNLPSHLKVTHMNVNDNTIEGICCEELNVASVQFHPEEGPGPEDYHFIFENWFGTLERGVNHA